MNELIPVALDLETTDLSGDTILGYGLAKQGKATALQWDEHSQRLLDAMIDSGKYWFIFHNASFDVPVLRKHGFNIKPGTYDDTMVMAWVLDPGHETYNLDACCWRYAIEGKYDKPESWEVWDDYMAQYCQQDVESTLLLWEVLANKLLEDPLAQKCYTTIERPYIEAIIEFQTTGFLINADKLARLTAHLERKRDKLEAIISRVAPPIPEKLRWTGTEFVPAEDSLRLYESCKKPQPLLPTEMQQQWSEELVPIDADIPPGWTVIKTNTKTKRISGLVWVPMDDGDAGMVGHHNGTYPHCRLKEFNPNSGQQLAYLLQSRWGWNFRKKTKTGQPKTDAEELEWTLDGSYPAPMKRLLRVYLALTETNKMLDSFLYKFRDLSDGRHILRGSFNQTGTKTGRLSSSEPNLQNIPARGAYGHIIRSLVVAPPGFHIVGIDLSNIEGRVLAHYLKVALGDDSMSSIFEAGVDFHQSNADRWAVCRNDAKTLLYAVLYGAGPEKVGKGNKERGKLLMASLETNAPNLFRLKELVWEQAEANNGIIHDWFGRRLCYPNIIYSNALAEARQMIDDDTEHKLFTNKPAKLAQSLMSRAKRQIFNSLLQGTAASALKVLTLKVMAERERLGLRFKMAAAVHDELQTYCREETTPSLKAMLEEVFKTPLLSGCPIKGDAMHGINWSETH